MTAAHTETAAPKKAKKAKAEAPKKEVAVFEAGKDNKSKLEAISIEVKVRLEKGDKLMGQAEGHYMAAGLRLKEAQSRCKAEGIKFLEWLKANEIGKTKAYEVLAIADGRKTEKEAKEANKERQAKHRDKNKKARAAAEDAMEDDDEDDGLTATQRDFIDGITAWAKGQTDATIKRWAKQIGLNV